jgi:hypothetical protein
MNQQKISNESKLLVKQNSKNSKNKNNLKNMKMHSIIILNMKGGKSKYNNF